MTHNGTVPNSSTSKFLAHQFTAIATAATLMIGGTTAYTLWRFYSPQSSSAQSDVVSIPAIKTITALGRLEPSGEVIKLSAPTSVDGSRVDQLLVKEGEQVKTGQIIAILDSRDRLQTALQQAEEQVKVAEANLAKVKAGAKAGEIEAQRATISRLGAERSGDIDAQIATIDRLTAELENAQAEDRRYEKIYQEGVVSISIRDSKHLAVEVAQQKLNEAQTNLERTRLARQAQIHEANATLARIAEVRPVDVLAAAAEVDAARATVNRAKANLEQAYVRSPQNAQILKIHTKSGELIGADGIVEIGQTHQMYAIAEVYESDVHKMRVGQQVRVTSDSLQGELQGNVEYIGLQVLRQNVINTDPSANIDARVVEVKVRLDKLSSQKAANFTNLQVKAVIAL